MIRTLLAALLVIAAPAGAAANRIVQESRVIWSETNPEFGGFSGLEVVDGGAGFVSISDRGHWATARMVRTDGRLTGIETTGFGPLRAISGEAVSGDDIDAEGLARHSDGSFYVSFEAFHRIRRHPTLDAPAEEVPSPREFRRLQNNSGLEALTFDAADVLYAIPERSGALTRPFPVYRLRDGVWDADLNLPRSGDFLVAGADFGPDGRLYVLERDFGWLRGFSTRIRRFSLDEAKLDAGETIFETAIGSAENYEGISVWRDEAGILRITLITDDNFFTLQSTVVAEYRFMTE